MREGGKEGGKEGGYLSEYDVLCKSKKEGE